MTETSLSPEQLAELQERFTAVLPRIDAAASYRFRHLHGESKDEALAESRAVSWREFRKIAEADERDPVTMAGMIGQFAARKVAEGRGIVPGKTTLDVLSKSCRDKHAYGVESLSVSDGEAANPKVLDALRDHREASPADEVQTKLDFASWVERQTPKRRDVVRQLADGRSTSEIAEQRGITPGAVALMRRQLREEWER